MGTTPSKEQSAHAILGPWQRDLKQEQAQFLLGFFLLSLTLIAGIGLLAVSGWFILASGLAGVLLSAGVIVAFDVFTPGAAIRSLALTRTLGRYGERVVHHNAVLAMQTHWRVALFRGIVSHPHRYLTQLRSADLIQRLTADLSQLDSLYLRLRAPRRSAWLSTFVVACVVAVVVDSTLWLVLIIGMLLLSLLAATWGVRRSAMNVSAAEAAAQRYFRAQALDYVEGMLERCAAHSQSDACHQMLAVQHRLIVLHHKRLATLRRWQACTSFFAQGGVWLGLAYIILAVRAETLSMPIGALLFFSIYALSEVLQALPEQQQHFGHVLQSATRLNEIRKDSEEGSEQTVSTGESNPSDPVLAFKQVTLKERNKLILTDLNFSVFPFQQVAVLGTSGVGKSRLLSMATALSDVTSGQVQRRFHALDDSKFMVNDWRQGLAYIEQQSTVLQGTLAENLRIARPQASDDELWEALEFAELAEWARNRAGGLHTRIQSQGANISGGEARRLQFARLFLQDSPVVFLDEPFTGLDPVLRDKLKGKLSDWLASRTSLMVAHDLAMLPRVTDAYRLHGATLSKLDCSTSNLSDK
ncbi:amino acid ABC transporter ATP-binding/permease protein [Aliidiomarina sanyensis]|nr:ATP-binding cassette domain-containing protein [Aliidiomarina sanyensis]